MLNRTNWNETTTPLSADNLNNFELSVDDNFTNVYQAILNHIAKEQGVHGIANNEYFVKTKNSNNIITWEEIAEKPENFGLTADQVQTLLNDYAKKTEMTTAINNALQYYATKDDLIDKTNNLASIDYVNDAIANAQIPDGSDIDINAVQTIAINVKQSSNYATVLRINPTNPVQGEIYFQTEVGGS